MTLTLVNWNVGWATPRSRRWKRDGILGRIESHNPDVICLTETDVGLLAKAGDIIYPQIDRVSEKKGRMNRRKVLLWSKQPWKPVDLVGHDSLLPGRFVSGVAKTPIGEMTIVGVCIPYHMSRVQHSEVKRSPWEDHEEYLDNLKGVLDTIYERTSGKRMIVMGDFNQKLGSGSRAPHRLRAMLESIFSRGMTIVTKGLKFRNESGIDHIALSEDLIAECRDTISNIADNGKCLSKGHFGVVVRASTR